MAKPASSLPPTTSQGPASGLVLASAGALALLAIAAGTGLVPVSALSPTPPPTAVVPPAQPVVPAGSDVVGPPAPKSHGQVDAGAVTLDAQLGQELLLHGSDGEVYLVCNVAVDDDPTLKRQPVDLALVLDTSGSMAGSMDLLKRATLGIAERLGEQDRLSIVSYSTEGRQVYQGPATGAGAAALERAVAGLHASGGTNISDGLVRGAEALARPAQDDVRRVRRILLMTDGLANQGITDAPGLEGVVRQLRGSAITVSALGLGSRYDETLLGGLADTGGGAYHYVDQPEGLGPVYAAEVEALGRLRAKDALLTVTPRQGAQVREVVSWRAGQEGDATVVSLGDLAAGRELKVVVRLQAFAPLIGRSSAEQALPAAQTLVDVGLTYVDYETEVRQSGTVSGLGVGYTDSPALAQASVNAALAEELQQIRVARQLAAARQAAAAGEREKAKAMVLELKEVTGAEGMSFEAPSGEMREMDFDALADDMAAGAESERGRRAMKMGDAAARSAAR